MKNYLQNLKNDKKEIIKIAVIAIISFIFLRFFMAPYSNTGGYDITAEFSGYLMLFSFLLFLFINIVAKNEPELSCFICLSLIQLILAMTNFLILKLFITLLFKLIIFYSTIFLFLFILKKISEVECKK